MTKDSRFVHDEKLHHNFKDPKIIIEEILKHFHPKKVIDLWCWLGAFVKTFQDHWIDAYWVNWPRVEKDKLVMNEDRLIIKNLEEFCDFKKWYDMAITIEVAEHIDAKYADNFIKTITSCADIIIFSAAIPWQWWFKHVNEQSPEYREEKFNKLWYRFYDVFRWKFWNNKDIAISHRQNMFLVMKEWINLPSSLEEKSPRYIIHPELFNWLCVRNLSTFAWLRYFLWRIFYKIIWHKVE